jgi:hypothetical protein
MKKPLLLLLPLLFIAVTLSSYDIIRPVQTVPTLIEMDIALKQALEQCAVKSTDQLSMVNGFFGDPEVKILFPSQAQKAEKALRKLGMNKLCDDVILSLNRAAEDASAQAKPIFVNAARQITLQDGTNILLGSPDAATQYFKRTTSADLVSKIRPIIQSSLNKVGATKYYGDAADAYNKIPFAGKISPDITDYATQKAIDGLFTEMAKQELIIRRNINARPTPELQKVFEFAAKNKRF